MSKVTSLYRQQLVLSSLLKTISVISSILTLFVSLAIIGTKELSIYLASTTILEIFILLSTNSFLPSVLYKKDDNKHLINQLFTLNLFIGSTLSIILFIVLKPFEQFLNLNGFSYIVSLICLSIPIISVRQIPDLLNQYSVKRSYQTVVLLLSLIRFLLVIVLLVNNLGVMSLIIGYWFYHIASLLISFYFAKYNPQLQFKIRIFFKYLGQYFLNLKIIPYIGNGVIVIALLNLASIEYIAYWYISINLVNLLFQPIRSISLPLLFQFSNEPYKYDSDTKYKVLLYNITPAGIGLFLLYFVFNSLINLNAIFYPILLLFPFIVSSMLIEFVNFSLNILSGFKHKQISIIAIVTIFIELLLMLILIPNYSLKGFGYALLIGSIFNSICLLTIFNSKTKLQYIGLFPTLVALIVPFFYSSIGSWTFIFFVIPFLIPKNRKLFFKLILPFDLDANYNISTKSTSTIQGEELVLRLIQLGEITTNNYQFAEAEDAYKKAIFNIDLLNVTLKNKYKMICLECELKLVVILCKLYKTENAVTLSEKLFKQHCAIDDIVVKTSIKTCYCQALLCHCKTLNKSYNFQDALKTINLSLKLSGDLGDNLLKAEINYQAAFTHHLCDNLQYAQTHYKDAIKWYANIGYKKDIARCRAAIGRVMISMNSIEQAKKEFNDSVKIYNELGDDDSLLSIIDIQTLLTTLNSKRNHNE